MDAPPYFLAAATTFTGADWFVLGGYFLVLLASGVVLSWKSPAGTEDYFLGGRAMPTWAVAFSVLATSLSAATFIGGPEEAYRGDLTYLSANIGQILAAIAVAVFFIPAFYRMRASTVYELLESRFGRSSRTMAGWMFMLGRVLASGARLYIAALAAALILFGDIAPGHVSAGIAVLTIVGIFYTLVGGIRSVIWTDVIQTFVFVGAAGAALVILLHRIPFTTDQVLDMLRHPGAGQASKLVVLDPGLDFTRPHWGFDPGRSYTLLTAVFGFTLFYTAAFGTDQDMAQRMLTCRSAARGSWSVVSAIIGTVPVTLLFMVVGLLLYVFYVKLPEAHLAGASGQYSKPEDGRRVFLTFIMREMPRGMSGLMMAGLFAAGLSSLNSALNAMASSFVGDWYRRFRPDRDERHYLRVGRLAVIVWGVVLGLFAVACVTMHDQKHQTLIQFALGVMVFAYAGLLAVFLTALFTRRGNSASVAAALATGFVAVLAMDPVVWGVWARWLPIGDHTLADVRLAFPWRMLIATVIALAVCCAGRCERPPTRTATRM